MKQLVLISILLVLIASCSKKDSKDDSKENPITSELNYFDWNPDTVIYDTLVVDLNQDGTNDLKLEYRKVLRGTRPSSGPYYDYFASCFVVNPELKISLGTELNHNAREWNCLKFNDPISDNLTWYHNFDLRGEADPVGGVGVWDKNDSQGYVGFKLNSNGMTYFGWLSIKVEFSPPNRYYAITCLDYAISEIGEATILAGQKE